METDPTGETPPTGLIEGGIDAVVIGASADGLAAAAYLGKAGLKTVLLGAADEMGSPIQRRELASGDIVSEGEHLITQLDPDLIDDLGLYKHGVEYAARRLDTTYHFDDAEPVTVTGDWSQAFQSPDIAALIDAEKFQTFLDEALETAALLKPILDAPNFDIAANKPLDRIMAHANDATEQKLLRVAAASVDSALEPVFGDGPLRDLLTAEATFRFGAGPHEAFSYLGLIKRCAGEASGLQGAIAYPAGGAATVIDALRRAAQAAKVDLRTSTRVDEINIEFDKVAGVELSTGGQIRTPIVVFAQGARRLYAETLGPENVDIELQRRLNSAKPKLASLRAHIKLLASDDTDTNEDDEVDARTDGDGVNVQNRLVYAPPAADLRKAFNDARAGRVPEKLIVELIFPAAIDGDAQCNDAQMISVMAHPLPLREETDTAFRDAVGEAILNNLERIAPGLEIRVAAVTLATSKDEGAAPAPTNILQQWLRANAAASAGGVGGLFFCGPEAEIGVGLSCAPGRGAARAAVTYYRKYGRGS